jgi:hypothetical protein
MKLQKFIEFLELHKVTIVRHHQDGVPLKILKVDWDEKKVTIQRHGADANTVLKISTLLNDYYLMYGVTTYGRLPDRLQFTTGLKIMYRTKTKWNETKGVLSGMPRDLKRNSTRHRLEITWSDNTVNTYENDYWAREHFFVNPSSVKRVELKTYLIVQEQIGTNGQIMLSLPRKVIGELEAYNIDNARSQIPAIFKYAHPPVKLALVLEDKEG